MTAADTPQPMPETTRPKRRATYLHVSQAQMLRDWGRQVRASFAHEMPYLVGSAVTGPGWRDVDVRLILDDVTFASLAAILDVNRLNLAMSLWGQQATGLPIDFQVQSMTDANSIDGPRHPIGMS